MRVDRSCAVMALVLAVSACSGDSPIAETSAPTAPTPIQTTTAPTPTATTPGTTIPIAATATTSTIPQWPPIFPGVAAHADGWAGAASKLFSSDIIPSLVAIGPEGEILFTSGLSSEGLKIYELVDSDTYELVVAPDISADEPGGRGELNDFGFDQIGRLLVKPLGHPISVVDIESGSLDPLVPVGAVVFEVASDGRIISTDRQNLVWISTTMPEPTTEYVLDFDLGWGLAIGPGDVIAVTGRQGEIYDITDPSNPRLVTDDVPPGTSGESVVVFTPDGRLYWLGSQMLEVDFETGEVLSDWTPDAYGEIAPTPDGDLIIWSPNVGIDRVDPVERSSERLLTSITNTSALSIWEESVYAAYPSGNGESVVYVVEEGGSLQRLASFPIDWPTALAIDADGVGYLSGVVKDGDQLIDFPIISFGVADPEVQTRIQEIGLCPVFSVAVDRSSGTLYSSECAGVTALTTDGRRSVTPFPPGVTRGFITVVDGGGPLYGVLWMPETVPGEGEPHGLFRLDGAEWTEVMDLSDTDHTVGWAIPAACPDGQVYVVKHHTTDPRPSGQNHFFEVSPGGDVNLVLSGISTDAFAMDCDSGGRWLAMTGIGRIIAVDRP